MKQKYVENLMEPPSRKCPDPRLSRDRVSHFFNTKKSFGGKINHELILIKKYMEVQLERLEQALSQAEVIYLSTSKEDRVSARPVSPLNIGLHLYVRTSGSARKAKEMLDNPNVAVCVGNFYFTGKAKSLGSVYDAQNAQIKSAYRSRYPDSFGSEDGFIKSDEVFFEIMIEKLSEWVYQNGSPVGLEEQTVNT